MKRYLILLLVFIASYTHAQIRTLEGHTGAINSIAYSPDGEYIASGGNDGKVKIWRCDDDTLIKTINLGIQVHSVSYSNDGIFIGIGTGNSLDLYQNNTFTHIRDFSYSNINSITFSIDGQFIAAAGSNVSIFRISNSDLYKTIFPGNPTWSIAFSKNGEYLASGGVNNTVDLWKVDTWLKEKTLNQNNEVFAVCFSPDDSLIASASYQEIKIWRVSDGSLIRTIQGHSSWIKSIDFSPDGKYLVSGGYDKLVKIWSVDKGILLKSFSGHSDWVNSVAFSPDGRYVASGSSDKTIKIWNDIPTISIKSPIGGEKWSVGSIQKIIWEHYGLDTLNISYSINNGMNWIPVATNIIADSQSYYWQIPNTPSNECLIQISDAKDENFSMLSDSTFTILPLPSIIVDSVYGVLLDTACVALSVFLPIDYSLSAIELIIDYPESALSFCDVDTSKTLLAEKQWSIEANENNGKIYIAAAGSDDISTGGNIVNLLFYILNDTTEFLPISIDSIVFNTGIDSVISVDGGISIYTPYYGDTDLNGHIQAYDASQILKFLIGNIDLSTFSKVNSDVSRNNEITALDASIILQYLVGTIDSLPYKPSGEELYATGDFDMINYLSAFPENVEVPIRLWNGDNILSFEGCLTYNPDELLFTGINWSSGVDSFLKETVTDNGKIYFVGAGSSPNGSNELFITACFKYQEMFYGDTTVVELYKMRLNEQPAQFSVAKSKISLNVGIKSEVNLPLKYSIDQNYPNPFNSSTQISYSIPDMVHVEITIYDLNGKRVQTLVNGLHKPGNYLINWNPKNLSSGVYFYTIKTPQYFEKRKCLVIK
ncbi:MAG: T9SS type A sorting domain-containing protein [Candidatus Neomarinimicrobiota bacterium]